MIGLEVQTPQGFVVATECQKAAWDNGWPVQIGQESGWLLRSSHNAPGRNGLAAAGPQGPWFLAVDHAGVARELGTPADIVGPFRTRFAYPSASDLHHAVSRVYDFAKALPDDPLERFRLTTRALPTTT